MIRVYHPYHKWECIGFNMYSRCSDAGIKKEDGQELYRKFLSDLGLFENSLIHITDEWQYSCEHFLTNTSMNRVAWLGQASMAYHHKVPNECCGGYKLLTSNQRILADRLALRYLRKWEHEKSNRGLYKQMEIPWVS